MLVNKFERATASGRRQTRKGLTGRCSREASAAWLTPWCGSLPGGHFLFSAMSTVTATATVAPTIGLLPMPRKPIISTCAGTDDEPAN